MQIYEFGSWKELIAAIIGWAVSGAIIISLALLGLWLLKRYVGESSFAALTLLVAIIGAVIAVVQTRGTVSQKTEERSRSLAFATGLAEDAIQKIARPMPSNHHGNVPEPFTLTKDVASERLFTIRQMAIAADQIDLSKLPSANSMAAVVRLRAAFQLAIARIDGGLKSGREKLVLDDSLGDFMQAAEELARERDRLFPTYRVGNVLVQSPVDRR